MLYANEELGRLITWAKVAWYNDITQLHYTVVCSLVSSVKPATHRHCHYVGLSTMEKPAIIIMMRSSSSSSSSSSSIRLCFMRMALKLLVIIMEMYPRMVWKCELPCDTGHSLLSFEAGIFFTCYRLHLGFSFTCEESLKWNMQSWQESRPTGMTKDSLHLGNDLVYEWQMGFSAGSVQGLSTLWNFACVEWPLKG